MEAESIIINCQISWTDNIQMLWVIHLNPEGP